MKKKPNPRALTRPRRYRSLGCRLTNDEFEEFRVKAEAAGVTPSEWCRRVCVASNRTDPYQRALLEQGEWLRYVLGNFLLHLATDGKFPTREALKQAAAAGDQHKVQRTDALLTEILEQLRTQTRTPQGDTNA